MKLLKQLSVQMYSVLLNFYPKNYRQEFGKEMQYVYSQTLKDTVEEKGAGGIIGFWFQTAIDAGRSLINEHLENLKGGVEKNNIFMKKNHDILMDNKAFLWVGAGTLLLLMVPAFLMLFQIPLLDPGSGYEIINWGPEDFIVMGAMIFSIGSIFVLSARRIKKHRIILALGLLAVFFLIWIELAVDAVSRALVWIF